MMLPCWPSRHHHNSSKWALIILKKLFKILVFILKISRFQHHFSGNLNGWQNFFRDEKNTAHQNIGLFLRYSAQTYSITVGGIILMAINSLVLLDQASLTNSSMSHKMWHLFASLNEPGTIAEILKPYRKAGCLPISFEGILKTNCHHTMTLRVKACFCP